MNLHDPQLDSMTTDVLASFLGSLGTLRITGVQDQSEIAANTPKWEVELELRRDLRSRFRDLHYHGVQVEPEFRGLEQSLRSALRMLREREIEE